ncbi:MAG: hypothetical protein AAGA64_15710, partial [Bacteroidota bacterium]
RTRLLLNLDSETKRNDLIEYSMLFVNELNALFMIGLRSIYFKTGYRAHNITALQMLPFRREYTFNPRYANEDQFDTPGQYIHV